jgi:hypothetical protein
METHRLKIKIGDAEFDAEGTAETVQSQFEAFKELIANAPRKQELPAPSQISANQLDTNLPHLALEKILKTDGRVVSLTSKCDSINEAVLLILLGQKEQRNNQEVTGSEIMDGLEHSGYKLPRVDHTLNKLSNEGSVITMGIHRGRRYRLSNPGLTKALQIAKEVIATVP